MHKVQRRSHEHNEIQAGVVPAVHDLKTGDDHHDYVVEPHICPLNRHIIMDDMKKEYMKKIQQHSVLFRLVGVKKSGAI